MSKESKDFGVCKKCENMGHVFYMLRDEINCNTKTKYKYFIPLKNG